MDRATELQKLDASEGTTVAIAAAVIGCAFLLYWPTTSHLVGWSARDDSDSAGGAVFLAFLVMLWMQRSAWSRLRSASASAWSLVGIAICGTIWWIASLLSMRLATQLAWVGIVAFAVWAVLGWRSLRAMAFPMAVLVAATPVFSPLLPLLVSATAFATHQLLIVFGIPVLREGAFFQLPGGDWSIADACAGQRYLQVCIALGLLYAFVLFRARRRRFAFVAGAVFIGIAGNWLRAFLTLAITHWTGSDLLRQSHGTFGWVLYAAMLILYFTVAWRWRESVEAADTTEVARELAATQPRAYVRYLFAGMIAASGPLMLYFTPRTPAERLAPLHELPAHWNPAWTRSTPVPSDWKPDVVNPAGERRAIYVHGERAVTFYVALFGDPDWNSKLVTSVNRLANDENRNWTRASRRMTRLETPNAAIEVATESLAGRAHGLVAHRWYWIDGIATSSGLRARLAQLRQRLRGSAPRGYWVAIASSGEGAERTLAEFMRENGVHIDRWLAEDAARAR